MKLHYAHIFPTSLELIGLAFLDVAVIGLGNSRRMLDYYGLHSSGQVVQSSAHSAITSGLSKIDSLKFTDPVVTFAMWALIGIFCFSIVQGIARIYREIEDDKKLSSNTYIHPDNFNEKSFWHRVVLDLIGVLVCLALLAAGLYLFLAYALPVSLAYSRSFLLSVSLSHVGGLLISLVVMYGWLVVFGTLLKLFVNRHRLIANH